MTYASRGWLFRSRVERHLHSCQECRTRQAAIEAAGHFWNNTFRPLDLSPDRLESARTRFLDRATADLSVPKRLPSRSVWNMGLRVGAVTAAITCVLVAGINVWKTREARHPQAPPSVSRPIPSSHSAQAHVVETAPVAVASVVPAEVPVATPPAVPDTSDPRETAVDLLWVIHQAGLCRSGSVDVEISPSDDVAVRGVVDTVAQVNTLKELLGDVHGPYSFVVRAADSADAARGSTVVHNAIASPTPALPPLGDALIEFWLKAKHVDADRLNAEALRISNQVVSLANDAWIESWSVRHLQGRFGALSQSGRLRLMEMTHAHLDALRRVIEEERQLLAPMLGSQQDSDAETEVTLADVARLSELIQDTFASTSQTPAPLPERTTELRTLLSNISRAMVRWEQIPDADSVPLQARPVK